MHRIQIIGSRLRRAQSVCSCGENFGKLRLGELSYDHAVLDGRAHLERVARERQDELKRLAKQLRVASEDPLDIIDINQDQALCPFDERKLDLPLELNESPIIVSCSKGHQFDAYFESNHLVYLFPTDDEFPELEE